MMQNSVYQTYLTCTEIRI